MAGARAEIAVRQARSVVKTVPVEQLRLLAMEDQGMGRLGGPEVGFLEEWAKARHDLARSVQGGAGKSVFFSRKTLLRTASSMTTLQRHASAVKTNPGQWLPWNYLQALTSLATG